MRRHPRMQEVQRHTWLQHVTCNRELLVMLMHAIQAQHVRAAHNLPPVKVELLGAGSLHWAGGRDNSVSVHPGMHPLMGPPAGLHVLQEHSRVTAQQCYYAVDDALVRSNITVVVLLHALPACSAVLMSLCTARLGAHSAPCLQKFMSEQRGRCALQRAGSTTDAKRYSVDDVARLAANVLRGSLPMHQRITVAVTGMMRT